jgi:hypothetical protein
MNQASSGAPDGQVQNIRVDIPPGLISNPQAVPKCSSPTVSCSNDSQLGVVQLEVYELGLVASVGASVYNMVPPAGKVSDYAFSAAGTRIDIIGGVRSTSDDGLYFTIAVPSSAPPLIRSTLIFWGDPGDSAHNSQRPWSCLSLVLLSPCRPPASLPSHPAGTPFLSNPSGCLPPGQVSTVAVDSSTGDHAEKIDTTPVSATGCSSVPFTPSLAITPSTTQADAPTGLAVDVQVPQNQDPNGLASAHVKNAVVTLPPGMTLDPSAANGLQACSPAQFAEGSDAAPTCPAASQVGTVEIDTPLLAKPLTGSVFLGCDGSSAQTPCPASTGLAYLYVYATTQGQSVTQKLLGTVTASQSTGQLTTTFSDQPQLPFTDFKLNFKSGPTAPVANPLACGPATTSSSLTPYSGNLAAAPTTTFTVDRDGARAVCPQPAPFTPGFAVTAGMQQAGAFDDPLTFAFTRSDAQQYLSRIVVQLPPGLLGILASVPLCVEPQATQGTCSATSRIGATNVLAGAGSDPISQGGNVYLTGPYGGAPFGLSIVVPAIAGPFNLGTVVVRASISVDRTDAHLTITSDPLPQIVGGIPLRVRNVGVRVDRPGFMINPTSCAPAAIDATITSLEGAAATAPAPFQAGGCGALRFAPSLRLALSGNGQTTDGKHPTLSATVGSRLGEANVRSARVTLPLSLALDPYNSQHVCSVPASNADSCPAKTIIGSATVRTPLLSQPLTGLVYLVQGIRTNAQGQQIRTLPALLIPLRGQVAIDLRGQTSVDTVGRLVTTFPAVPDAPISSFTLAITGGRHGILVVTGGANLCRGAQRATAVFAAQSGRSNSLAVKMTTPCGKQAWVTKLSVRGHTVRLRVSVPGAGRLSVGGSGLATANRRVLRASTVSFTLHLTRAALRHLRRHGELTPRVWIRYTPRGAATQTIVTRRTTIHR